MSIKIALKSFAFPLKRHPMSRVLQYYRHNNVHPENNGGENWINKIAIIPNDSDIKHCDGRCQSNRSR